MLFHNFIKLKQIKIKKLANSNNAEHTPTVPPHKHITLSHSLKIKTMQMSIFLDCQHSKHYMLSKGRKFSEVGLQKHIRSINLHLKPFSTTVPMHVS